MRYTVIGDVHGYADELEALLRRCGFRELHGAYRKDGETALFVGDLIDRGPGNTRVLRIARAMLEAGTAQVAMGNHELNAIHYAMIGDGGLPLRPHTERNTGQHASFLREFPPGSASYREALRWMSSLPLWLDLGALRVVHAFWREAEMMALSAVLDGERRLTAAGLHATGCKGSVAHAAAETLLKGPERALPDGFSFRDKDGHERREARIRWWATDDRLRSAVMVPAEAAARLPDREFPELRDYAYPQGAPPVFVGHYWLHGEPFLAGRNVACLDFSVARRSGKLVAYRWDGEPLLAAGNLVHVARIS